MEPIEKEHCCQVQLGNGPKSTRKSWKKGRRFFYCGWRVEAEQVWNKQSTLKTASWSNLLNEFLALFPPSLPGQKSELERVRCVFVVPSFCIIPASI